jgi:hypothetical protein
MPRQGEQQFLHQLASQRLMAGANGVNEEREFGLPPPARLAAHKLQHLGPLYRPEAQPGDDRRQRHHPNRQDLPACQVIQERTLAGLEPAKDGDLNAPHHLKLVAARNNLKAESIQLQFYDQSAELVENAVVLEHNSLPFSPSYS